jgi:hypothetical protein
LATVTYRKQPGIHATRGTVPLAGTKHLYTVSRVLWHPEIETALRELLIGKTLHVCCGKSRLGDILVDLHEPDVHVRADAARLPFAENSVETVLCDPPYNGRFQWNHDMLNELAFVASQRIIFQHWFIPANGDGLYKKAQEKFALSAVLCWQPRTYFGRVQVISVFDRRAIGG